MSDLNPTDNGVRRFRPGPLLIFSTAALLILGAFLAWFIRSKQSPPPVVVANPIEEIRKEAKVPEPVIPSSHPLIGKHRIFLADGCLHRYQELSFERNLSEEDQHPYPIVTVEGNDPCLWEFKAVEEKEHVYQIYCADSRFPEQLGKELTYTRVTRKPLDIPCVEDSTDLEYLDDEAPFITIRDGDPCEWLVQKYPDKENLSYRDQYEIYCLGGSEPFSGEALGWIDDHEHLVHHAVIATLGHHGAPSWWILPEGEQSKPPRRATHLIINPVSGSEDDDLFKKSLKHFQENSRDIFQIKMEVDGDSFVRKAATISYRDLVSELNENDPITKHPLFPSLFRIPKNPIAAIEHLKSLSKEPDFFPMIIPLNLGVTVSDISQLTFENTKFYINDWEELKELQFRLDESDQSDGRIFVGEKFTYFLVHWEP